jgi:hypothetical protein
MTTVTLDPGICGHITRITIEQTPEFTVKAAVQTTCPNITKIPAELLVFDPVMEMTNRGELPLRIREYIPHAACPFVSALVKAAEAEAGLALRKDASIRFE